MQPIRVKVCQESDLRMLGDLARNIQRVLPVTQADIDAAAALGKGWVVWKVIEVSDPLDNLRGGTQLIIKQNSVQPGQNVRRVIFVSGPGGETVVIGPAPSPLLLPDAIANTLHYVKAFGGTEQNGTPTPDAPVDIVCNNGALKVRHQSGLPLGYQPYEYITAGGNQWLDTGVKLANTDIVETEFKNSSSTGFGALYGVFAMGDSSAFYANGTYYGYDVINNKVNTGISVDTNWHTLRQDFGNGIITLDGSDTTYTPFEFDNSKNNYLFARYYSNSYGYGFKGSCKRFKVIRNGVVICDLIPAVQLSDNEIGMYDLVNDVFRGNVGSGDFTATNPVNDLEIYVDGTVETIGIIGKNLFNKATVTEGFILTSGDAPSASTGNGYSDYIPVVPGQYYYIGQRAASTSANNDRVITYDKDKNVLQQTRYAATGAVYRTNNANARFIRFNLNLNYLNTLQFELGQTPTDYEPYFNGGTATCEPLLAIGDYADVQEILSGNITRNVGVKVFDGSEDWRYRSNYNVFSLANIGMVSNGQPLATHFPYNTFTTTEAYGVGYIYTNNLFIKNTDCAGLTAFKQFLAAQAAAGTPVIVVYPLATPTTESVTGQTLQVQAGDNTLEITQASMSGLELEAEYEQGVEASVEEIEP